MSPQEVYLPAESAAGGSVENAEVSAERSAFPRLIRLMICDDHLTLSDALAVIVGIDPRFHLVADPFSIAEDAVAAVAHLKPDVVLMDVEFPGEMNGIAATRQIVTLRPSTKVLVMSGSTDPEQMLLDAIDAGAAGFLPKSKPATSILSAVVAVADGESLIDAEKLRGVLERIAGARSDRSQIDRRTVRLTRREREILQRIAEGESNEHIAGALLLSVHTVHTHVRNILLKLEVHSKLQAVALAVRVKIVTV